jgi:hypothetical protein
VRKLQERTAKKEDIDEWTKKCVDLQMLKFGRCVDLDDLEADADRTKEVRRTLTFTEGVSADCFSACRTRPKSLSSRLRSEPDRRRMRSLRRSTLSKSSSQRLAE